MKLLIIRLSAIGDTIHSLPVAAAIKQAAPNTFVAWLVEPVSASLVNGNPCVDKVFILPRKKWLRDMLFPWMWPIVVYQVINFVLLLRKEKFDVAIDLQGLLKSAIWCIVSGARKRFGFAKTREGAQWFLSERFDVGNYFRTDIHIVDLNLKLVDFIFAKLIPGYTSTKLQASFPLPVTSENVVSKLKEMLASSRSEALNTDKYMARNVVLITGTTWSTKIWSPDKWCQLAKLLEEKLECRICLVGSKNESLINSQIVSWLKRESPQLQVLDLTAQTTLLELKTLFEMSYLVVGGDSGPLHLAAAVNKPYVVGIYGSTPWIRNGPYGSLSRSIKRNIWCQPCFEKECPLGTIDCLKNLGVQDVFDQIILHLDAMQVVHG